MKVISNLIPKISQKEQGFTIIETITTLIVAGILTAIATPSLVGMYRQQKVKEALEQLEGALEEAQRQAMLKGQGCLVDIDTTNNEISSANSNCLLSTRSLPEEVTMATNIAGGTPQIEFSYKGNTSNITTNPANAQGTIVISRTDSSGYRRCLVITNGLGIMRTGFYDGSTSPITSNNCTTSE